MTTAACHPRTASSHVCFVLCMYIDRYMHTEYIPHILHCFGIALFLYCLGIVHAGT